MITLLMSLPQKMTENQKETYLILLDALLEAYEVSRTDYCLGSIGDDQLFLRCDEEKQQWISGYSERGSVWRYEKSESPIPATFNFLRNALEKKDHQEGIQDLIRTLYLYKNQLGLCVSDDSLADTACTNAFKNAQLENSLLSWKVVEDGIEVKIQPKGEFVQALSPFNHLMEEKEILSNVSSSFWKRRTAAFNAENCMKKTFEALDSGLIWSIKFRKHILEKFRMRVAR